MPIHRPHIIERVSVERFRSLDYFVMGQMFASQNDFGRLADEQVYRSDVARRLESVGIQSNEEVPVKVTYETFTKILFIDLVISSKAVYELKTVSALNTKHVAQLLTYLYLLDVPRGKLVNFRSATVESQFVNAPIPREERCDFSVSDQAYRGALDVRRLVIDLVRDWGTSLSVSLYRQAVVHLLGGQDSVERMIPLTCDGRHIANQRFHLIDNNTAFELTAFARPDQNYASQLQRLLKLSPLRCLHWINIGPHCVNFQTVERT